jgi:uncharacterized spore protein YtfJ
MATNDILNRAAAILGPHRVFGPPHTENGITVIPAANIRGGGGGGSGRHGDEDDGEGGGFGVSASPAGALLIDGATVKWKVPLNVNGLVMAVQTIFVAYFLFRWLTERSKARAQIEITRLSGG